ncbi:hypothetical protein BGX30_004390 [Mortierella sp. GBA39]|nr:hypothetical protein BGX30_004390 [Mortierella sp. GBA39]
MPFQEKLEEEGIKHLQEWVFGERYGYVATREDEDGRLIVLWKDVENMIANSVPKYATIRELSVPFHFHKNLTEKEPRRISYYPNSRIRIQSKYLGPTDPQVHVHEVKVDPMVYYLGLFALVVIVLRSVCGSSSSSKSKNEVSPTATEAFKRNGNESCHCHQQQQSQPPINEKPVGNVRACCTAHCCCHHQHHNVPTCTGN